MRRTSAESSATATSRDGMARQQAPQHLYFYAWYLYATAIHATDGAPTDHTFIDALGRLGGRLGCALFGLSFKLRHYPEMLL